MGRLKISHVISDSNIGGAGVLLSSLTASLADIFDLSVFLPRGAKLASGIAARGIKVTELPMASDKSFSAGDVQGFFSLFKSYPADIVHTHGALSARLGARLAGIKACLSTRHCAIPTPAVRKKSPITRGVYNFCTDLTVSTADFAKRNLIDEGIPEKRILTIRNGVAKRERLSPEDILSKRRELGIPDGSRVLGVCARLEWVKGIDLIISALPRLISQGYDVYLVIVGDGSQREALIRRSARLGVLDRVKFCGFIENPTPYQSIFDININASRGTETSCLATSECMSMGIPTVASDFGGNTEMIIPYRNGALFNCDSLFSLTEVLGEILADEELLSELSVGAEMIWRDRFSLSRMKDDYIALYRQTAKTAGIKA